MMPWWYWLVCLGALLLGWCIPEGVSRIIDWSKDREYKTWRRTL
jgi:hypothetical protein